MKLLYSILFIAFMAFPFVGEAGRIGEPRPEGPFREEAREDFRNDRDYNGGGFYGEGFYGEEAPRTYRQHAEYQEEVLQNAGDPMEDEEIQNLDNMANEPDIG